MIVYNTYKLFNLFKVLIYVHVNVVQTCGLLAIFPASAGVFALQVAFAVNIRYVNKDLPFRTFQLQIKETSFLQNPKNGRHLLLAANGTYLEIEYVP